MKHVGATACLILLSISAQGGLGWESSRLQSRHLPVRACFLERGGTGDVQGGGRAPGAAQNVGLLGHPSSWASELADVFSSPRPSRLLAMSCTSSPLSSKTLLPPDVHANSSLHLLSLVSLRLSLVVGRVCQPLWPTHRHSFLQ